RESIKPTVFKIVVILKTLLHTASCKVWILSKLCFKIAYSLIEWVKDRFILVNKFNDFSNKFSQIWL
nr:hypothetical protein [Campylobacter sp.]